MALRGTVVLVVVVAALIGCSGSPSVGPSSKPTDVATSGNKAVAEDSRDEPKVPAEDLKALVEGNNAFAIALYKKIAEKETGNIVLSPYSISTALAMTYAGARGKTAEEMAKVLGLTKLGDRAHPAHSGLARQLRSDGPSGPTFLIANALWGQRGLPFRDEFSQLTRNHYGAGLQEVDFAADTDGSRRTINGWVGKQTQGKILELLKPGHVNPATKAVLTNAIYFKGKWTFRFPSDATCQGVFHRSTDEQVTLPFMTQTANLLYIRNDVVEVLELPYQGSDLSMVLILPMQKAMPELPLSMIDSWMRNAMTHEVTVSMPRFRLKMTKELTRPLDELGMPNAFSEAADFGGIAPGGLSMACVVHEAAIEVDEAGTEAVAATAVNVGKIDYNRVQLRLDRSFVVAIRDRRTGIILFLGRLVDPDLTPTM